MSELYTFTGSLELMYPEYRDEESDTVLVAVPGESYSLRPVREGLPVPPPDGRWQRVVVPQQQVKSAKAALKTASPEAGRSLIGEGE